MGIVVQHPWFHVMFRSYQSELDHQLTTVTNPQTQRIFAFVEIVQRKFRFLVIQEGSCPTFGRT
ncbi:hypothetical protein SDC9_189789 [bioreactor metagenome]|uniref:Uncharacterized protein n=1 Tax=bioreactor metagenome TaxID=1076179 RepID=A0A645I422_9ZZZZ